MEAPAIECRKPDTHGGMSNDGQKARPCGRSRRALRGRGVHEHRNAGTGHSGTGNAGTGNAGAGHSCTGHSGTRKC